MSILTILLVALGVCMTFAITIIATRVGIVFDEIDRAKRDDPSLLPELEARKRRMGIVVVCLVLAGATNAIYLWTTGVSNDRFAAFPGGVGVLILGWHIAKIWRKRS